MEKTWRWFGKKDKITLSMLRQIGVEGIVTALHEVPNGDIWTLEAINDLKQYIESYGLRWSVVESLPVCEAIKYAGPDWEENIEDLGIENNIKALIINNFDKRINLAKDLQDYYLSEEEFKDILVETPIPGSVAMKDTSLSHLPIVVLQPQHQAASAVKRVVKELVSREVF